MTKAEEVYVSTLNLLGSDPEPECVQDLLDGEHMLADPEFAERLKERKALVNCA